MASLNARMFTMLVIGVVLGVMVGFVIGKSYNGSAYLKQIAQTAKLAPETPGINDSVFSSLTATVQGKVTNVNSSKVTVANQSGKSGEYEVSNNVVVLKFSGNGAPASPSAGLKAIELNKEAIISLTYQDKKFVVVSMTVVPPAGPPPGVGASPSAIKR